MHIEIENLGKRFNRDWIFRNLNLKIAEGQKIAITGRNGSGKSTLLKILGSYSLHTEGAVSYLDKGVKLAADDLQLKMNFAAPYFNLIEEFTLAELLVFHQKFKTANSNLDEVLKKAELSDAKNKSIKDFSSGMKQRTKLILAFSFDSEIIFLDEPTSNLDESGISLFQNMVKICDPKRTIVMASNLAHEIEMCEEKIILENFQPKYKILR
ncbi:MAG: ABC-type multidrug transport system ATPase subunit [Cyclobacteriaceae bacterium]|jgi:ABC-type multidrug transport system ATPase subunit